MSNIEVVRLDSLERRLRRSERPFWVALFGWIVTVAVGVIVAVRVLPDIRIVSDTIRFTQVSSPRPGGERAHRDCVPSSRPVVKW